MEGQILHQIFVLNLPRPGYHVFINTVKEWAGYVSHNPKTLSDVLLQAILNNSRIAPNGKSIFVKDLYNLGIQNLNNIVGENGKLKTLKEIINTVITLIFRTPKNNYFFRWSKFKSTKK